MFTFNVKGENVCLLFQLTKHRKQFAYSYKHKIHKNIFSYQEVFCKQKIIFQPIDLKFSGWNLVVQKSGNEEYEKNMQINLSNI